MLKSWIDYLFPNTAYVWPKLRFFVSLLIVGFLGSIAFYAALTFVERSDEPSTPTACNIDKQTKQLSFENCQQAWLSAVPSIFAPPHLTTSFPDRKLRLWINNTDATPVLSWLHLGVPDALFIHGIQTNGEGVQHTLVDANTTTDFGERIVQHPRLVLPVSLSSGVNQIEFTYRLHANGKVQPRLYNDANLRHYSMRRDLGNGGLVGIMVMLLFLSTTYGVFMRDKAHLLYAPLMACEIIFLFQIEGYAFAWWWPHAAYLNNQGPSIFGSSVLATHALFAIVFLNLRHYQPKLYQVHWLILCAIPSNLLFVPSSYQILVLIGMAVIYCGLALWTAFQAVQHRQLGAPLYLLGVILLSCFSFFLFILAVLGLPLLPSIDFLDYPKFGLFLESACFSAAMLNRIRMEQKQVAQTRMRRMSEAQELLSAERARQKADLRARETQLQLASASHDISQPLAALRFAADALKAHSSTTHHTIIAQHLDQTLNYAQDLLRNLMQQTRKNIDVHDYELNISSLFAKVMHAYAAQAQEKDLDLDWVKSKYVFTGSELIMTRILHNLVGNAVRYSHAGGRVVVGLRRRHGGVEIQVHDTGSGLLPQQIERLQQAFTQGENASDQGHGLGLFIVRSLCAQSGYQLRIRSTLRKGSCFAVFIPEKPQSP